MSDVRTTGFTIKELQTLDTLEWKSLEGWQTQPHMQDVEHAIIQPQIHYWRRGEQLAAVDFTSIPRDTWDKRYKQVRTDLLTYFSLEATINEY